MARFRKLCWLAPTRAADATRILYFIFVAKSSQILLASKFCQNKTKQNKTKRKSKRTNALVSKRKLQTFTTDATATANGLFKSIHLSLQRDRTRIAKAKRSKHSKVVDAIVVVVMVIAILV